MDIKKIATTVLIAVLIPLFLALFIDAIYPEPQYEDYCNFDEYTKPAPPIPEEVRCDYYAYGPEYDQCISDGGTPRFDYDSVGCQTYKSCDFCNKEYDSKREVYNRNVFLIFAAIGLLIVVLGIYLKSDYIGAGLMFGGVITLFYSSIRYFSGLSKLLRAFVILVDLIVIIFISYKKIDKK